MLDNRFYMPAQNDIIEPILFISAIFTLVGIFTVIYLVYFNKRKLNLLRETEFIKQEFSKQLLQSQIEVQEATFSTLGKELHDNIGQLLGTAKMLIGVSQRNLSASADTIKTADETLGKAIQELRSLSKTLNKEWLEQFDFRQNLLTEINRINAAGTVHISMIDTVGGLRLSTEEQIILFRIVQEAIQNSLKHAGARAVIIQLSPFEGDVLICVTDNGNGFVNSDSPRGVGMINMRHRTSLLKGNIEWKTEGPGTTVAIRIPQTNHT